MDKNIKILESETNVKGVAALATPFSLTSLSCLFQSNYFNNDSILSTTLYCIGITVLHVWYSNYICIPPATRVVFPSVFLYSENLSAFIFVSNIVISG